MVQDLWRLALILFVAHSAYAGTVTLKIQSLGGVSCEGAATLALQCLGKECESTDSKPRRVSIPDTVPIEVSTNRATRARLLRDGCWAPDVVLTTDSSLVNLPVWSAATISGTFGAVPAGKPPIASIDLTVQLPKAKGSPAFEADTFSAPCTVARQAWQCIVPATTLDVRTQAEGYTPWYFWRLEPSPREVLRLGELRIESGGSVIGWIESPCGDESVPVDVQLRVRTYAVIGVEQREFGLTAMTVRANERGFFQFRNVPLGAYGVSATSGSSTSVEPTPVDVDRTVEHRVRRPIQLIGPMPLQVHINPPVSTGGEPWKVVLHRTSPGSTLVHPVTESVAAADGSWVYTTPVGTYVLAVVDSAGSTQHSRLVSVDSDLGVVEVELQRVNVKGVVTVAKQPLRATLTFRARGGATATLKSDEEGNFEGTLAQDGQWSVQVRPQNANMYFASVPVSVTRAGDGSPSAINISLPSGKLVGTVVDALGKGIEADVQVFRERRMIAAAASNAAGEFSIVGLPAEEVFVRASAEAGDSALLPVTIREEAESAVDLVIAADVKISGRLQMRSGRPASGAFIRYTSPSMLELRETTAGASGDFSLSVPGALPWIDLVILAAGGPATIGRIEKPRRGDVIDLLLDEQGAALKILLGGTPSWPYLGRQGALVALASLFPPSAGGAPPGLSSEGYETTVAPGLYHICPTGALTSTCREVLLAPFTQTVVDFRKAAAP